MALRPTNCRKFLKNQQTVAHLLRRLSVQTTVSLPPPQNDDAIITEAGKLLKTSDQEWNTAQLNQLLFSDSSSSPPPRLLFQITRRLPSSSKALKFMEYVKKISDLPDTHLALSSTFQGVLELASRERGSGANLLELYRKSKEWSIPLTVNSTTLLLRCFGQRGMVEESLALFSQLERKIAHVCNVMIDVLLRAGRLDDALKVLEEMFQSNGESNCRPDSVTGDMFFSVLLRRKNPSMSICDEKIVNWVLRFGELGVFPSSFLITQIITNLCRSGKTDAGWDFLHELMKLGASVEAAPFNSLLTGLGKDRNFKRMNELMAKMKELDIQPNVITYGILINHLCKLRRVDEALEVLRKMGESKEGDGVSVEPDVIIYNTVITGLCKVGRQDEGLVLLEKMRLQKGHAPNIVTYNCLIDGFCKAGEIEKGRELFEEMKKEGVAPNIITANTLIDGMCRHGRINTAVVFFGEMERDGLKGDAFTYSIFINAFCIVNNIDKAMDFFDRMVRNGCSPDAIVYSTLISGLSRAGRMNDAHLVYLKMKEVGLSPDLICYNVLIGGFCSKMKIDEAHEVLKEMMQDGLKPDVVTYNTLISYFSKTGNSTTVQRLMKTMIKDGVMPTDVTYGTLIHAYCLEGNLDEAMKIFADMNTGSKVKPNTVIYNILIDSLCKKKDVEHALLLMEDMKMKGVKPNATTFNAVFKSLEEQKWLTKAFELMDTMTEQDCNPDYITMEILTKWFSSVGEIEKLKIFVSGNKVSAYSTQKLMSQQS